MPATILTMSRFMYFLLALFGILSAVIAAPLPENDGFEKRTTHTGRGTWFYVGLGNCGWESSDSDLVVAMSKAFYDSNSGGNCGQTLDITWGGKTVTATMVDSCPGCGLGDLDMSPGLFQRFASLNTGVLNKIEWHFNSKA